MRKRERYLRLWIKGDIVWLYLPKGTNINPEKLITAHYNTGTPS